VIPVEKINGPVLAVCGTDDTVRDSCAYGKAIMARLTDDEYTHSLLQYPAAGHLGSVLAYQPGSAMATTTGGTGVGTDRALARAWPKELAFILDNS
jgi:hypothetical protein